MNQLNKPCLCGSKKKYKNCCKQRFVSFNLKLILSYAEELNETNESQMGMFKSHYSKLFTSFSLELLEKGFKKVNYLMKKYNDLWQEYCGNINIDYPEKEYYFIHNAAKSIGAEVNTEEPSEEEISD